MSFTDTIVKQKLINSISSKIGLSKCIANLGHIISQSKKCKYSYHGIKICKNNIPSNLILVTLFMLLMYSFSMSCTDVAIDV